MFKKIISLKTVSILIGLLLTGHLYAADLQKIDLQGIVTDEEGSPISFTNVFLQARPSVGTITDEDGRFRLSIADNYADGILVFTFAGYETATVDLSRLRDKGKTIRVSLKENVIYLDEVIVYARPEKISDRKQIKNLLQRVREQMEKDFPPEKRAYRVLSDYYIYNNGKVIASETAYGTLQEIPIKGMFGMDSLIFDIDTRKTHFDRLMKLTFSSLGDSLMNDEQKALFEEAKSKNVVHEMYWGSHPVSLFDRLEDKPRFWEKAKLDDGNLLLVYTQKKNMFGIIKYVMKVNYVLDPDTYSLISVKQTIEGEAHIPFGYKLDKSQLKVLNLFTQGSSINKFRIKHGFGSVEKTSSYRRIDGRMRPEKKSFTAKSRIENRKGVGITLHNTSDIKVLEYLK